jgi:N5-(cytidine 5'-diphosphoramidyl)-L-glutamine hydrolase
MRIGISQREETIGRSGHLHDCLGQNWYSLLKGHNIIPIPNVDSYRNYDFDMLILSAGNDSSNRFKTERAVYSYALEKGIPVLGVCHGALFLARMIGAETKPVEGHIGNEHLVKLDGRNVVVNSYHELTISKLPDEYEAIATDFDGNIEGFKHKSLPIFGILWHPDKQEVAMLPEYLDNLLGVNKDIFSQNFDWMDNI